MGTVIELQAWRNERRPAGPCEDVERLEAAVARLEAVTRRALGDEPIAPPVETELLAIIGELAVGLVGEATARAERLVEGLSGGS